MLLMEAIAMSERCSDGLIKHRQADVKEFCQLLPDNPKILRRPIVGDSISTNFGGVARCEVRPRRPARRSIRGHSGQSSPPQKDPEPLVCVAAVPIPAAKMLVTKSHQKTDHR